MKLICSVVLFISSLALTSAQAQTPVLRGIYIDKFAQILGNTAKEDSLLHYAQDSAFNYLALYDLQNIDFSNSWNVNLLAGFIRRARENFGVQYVGAVGESYYTFQSKIAPYNDGRINTNEKFNVFNLEFEFWTISSVIPGAYYCTQYLAPNNCSCDSSGAFKFFIDQVRRIDSLATIQGALSETYVGWFNEGQGQQMAHYLDRILLHVYRIDPSSVFGYSSTRLAYLASLSHQVDVVPIFSSEPDFMGPWLNSHSMHEAYAQYQADFDADNSIWKPFINLLGYQWFDYSFMPKPVPGSSSGFTPSITASGATTFCLGGSVTLTASAGSSYLWFTGATGASIQVSASGSYTCQVTLNGVTKTSSAINVLVNVLPIASFVASPPTNGSAELISTSLPGRGSISMYQWYLNGNAIGGATDTSYTASSDGDYSLQVTNSNGCSHTSPVQSINVGAYSCELSTPEGCASINTSTTSFVVSWKNMPPCDSVIIEYKKDRTNSYDYLRIPYTGNNVATISNISPNITYSWRVKTSCGNQYSDYSTEQFSIIHTTINAAGDSIGSLYEKSQNTEQYSTQELVAYPNPAKEILNLTFVAGAVQLGEASILDISGRIILKQPVSVIAGDNSLALNVSELPAGAYFASLKMGSIILTKRILIQN